MKVITYGNPVLRKKAKKVKNIDTMLQNKSQDIIKNLNINIPNFEESFKKLFQITYAYFLLSLKDEKDEKDETAGVIYIPGKGFLISSTSGFKEESSGGFHCEYSKNTRINETKLLKIATIWFREYAINDWATKFKIYSLHACISAILSRVMSHDLGSHMLANADLGEVEEGDVEQKNYFNHLKEYIRTRMVFIAEATTADPFWIISLPFVAQIIYPFEKFEESPSPVCRHIAESEGVEKVIVKVLYEGKKLIYSKDEEKGIWRCEPYDIFVAMPTGLIGNHAFYCILENVIRNGAKYGKKDEKSLTVSIRLDTKYSNKYDKDYIRVRVWDDHSVYCKDKFQNICRFFPPNTLRNKINEVDGSWRIIDDAGRLVSGGWGIKEMRIAAAWLRKERLVDALMKEDEYDPPLIRPIVVNSKGEEVENYDNLNEQKGYYMGYEFYMLKPKEVFIIDPKFKDINSSLKEKLSLCGVDLACDLGEALNKRIRHYACLVKVPEEEKEEKEWLSIINSRRDELPSVLIIVSKDKEKNKEKISGSIYLDISCYEKLKKQLLNNNFNGLPIELLKIYKKWIKEVLNAPKSLKLLLHLNPNPEPSAPNLISNPWEKTEKEFNKNFQNWRMIVHTKEGKYSNSGNDLIVYDYHGVWKGEDSIRPSYFYEPCFKNQPAQIVLFNPPNNDWVRLRLALGLIEAAVANVAIIDERIWLNWQNPDTVIESGALEKRRIFIPDENLENLDEQDLVKWLDKNEIKILVIHQGILDKMFQTRDEIEKWIKKLKEKVPFIVVESDRGEGLLPKLPRNARFAPFAAIEPWISTTGPSKYQLVQTLLSAKRGGEEK